MDFVKCIPVLIVSMLFVLACQKEAVDLQWEILQKEKGYQLCSAWFLDQQQGFVCGGQRYDQAILQKTRDGGASWEVLETGINKIIFDLYFFNEKKGIAVANDAKMLYTFDGGTSWELWQHNITDYDWQPFRAIDFFDESIGFVVGGGGYDFGVIFRSLDGGQSWDQQHFDSEFRDVQLVSNQTAFACGYGVVYKTIDAGANWELLDVKGDFFTAMHFVSETTGYVVGNQGKIVKTIDGGTTWKTLKKMNNLLPPGHHFERVYFENEQEGLVVGRNIVLQTMDGGDSWQKLADLDFQQFNAIVPLGTQEWIVVGDEGTIVRLKE